MYHIYYSNGKVIDATADHPFYIAGNWINVRNLSVNDSLTTFSNQKIAIDSIVMEVGPIVVYNFEVDEFHTYFVTDENLLVHNNNCDMNKKPGQDHHIGTNKNYKSTARGGPWSPKFEKIFKSAGLDINKDPNNIINVIGHKGFHPQEYHEYVFNKLITATKGLEEGSAAQRSSC